MYFIINGKRLHIGIGVILKNKLNIYLTEFLFTKEER